MTSAETAYLFRHALLREAAYEMQMPGDRSGLHELAFHLIEQAFGGRAPDPPPFGDTTGASLQPHPTDGVAHELAHHAELALEHRLEADLQSQPSVTRQVQVLYLRRSAELLERDFQEPAAAAAWGKLATLTNGSTRMEALCRQAASFVRSSQTRRAEPLLQATAAQGIEENNARVAGAALGNLALVYKFTGRMAEAEQAASRAIDFLRAANNRRGEGIALGNLATIYQDTGRPEQAELCYLQALELHREVGNRRDEGVALGNLAIACNVTGRPQQAEELYTQALAVHREVGNRRFEGIALANLALLYQGTGRVPQAEPLYAMAVAIHREVANRHSEANALGNLALMLQFTGRLAEAEEHLNRALALSREIGDQAGEGINLGNLAGLYHATQRGAEARRAFEDALALHRRVGNRRFEGAHLCDYALCLLAAGEVPLSHALWRQGASILRDLRDVNELGRKKLVMEAACAKAGVPPLDEDEPPAATGSLSGGPATR